MHAPKLKVVSPTDRQPDEPQEWMLQWLETGDEAARTRALLLLKQEWAGRILKFVANEHEADIWLQDALVELCLPRTSESGAERGRPRVLAPERHVPAAWRGRVLRNWMISRWRKQARERQRWMSIDDPAFERSDEARETPNVRWHTDESLTRLREALEAVPIKPRSLLMLRFGFDTDELTHELAEALGEDEGTVATRLRAARKDPSGREGAFLTDAELRVVFPHGELRRRRDTARKSMARAMSNLRVSLREVVDDGR